MPRGVAEHKPLPHIGGQGDFIREIKIGLQGDGTAIDERVSIMERRAVGQGFVTPVDSLVSSEGRHASIDVECLRVVTDKV